MVYFMYSQSVNSLCAFMIRIKSIYNPSSSFPHCQRYNRVPVRDDNHQPHHHRKTRNDLPITEIHILSPSAFLVPPPPPPLPHHISLTRRLLHTHDCLRRRAVNERGDYEREHDGQHHLRRDKRRVDTVRPAC